MKALRYFLLNALLIAVGLGMASDASAQREPREKHRRGDSSKVRPDSVRHDNKGDVRDKPGHRGRVHELINFFNRNDSCREVLLSVMSAEDAATLTRLYAALKGSNEQLQTLRAELRAAREARDTAAFRAISEQLRTLYRQIGANHKAIAELMHKYHERAMRVRKDCGSRPTREDQDKDREVRTGGIITPNPVSAGGTAVLTLNLATESRVSVTISNDAGRVLVIPTASLAAGEQQIALDVSSLTRGVYLVQVQIGDKREVLKLMIR